MPEWLDENGYILPFYENIEEIVNDPRIKGIMCCKTVDDFLHLYGKGINFHPNSLEYMVINNYLDLATYICKHREAFPYMTLNSIETLVFLKNTVSMEYFWMYTIKKASLDLIKQVISIYPEILATPRDASITYTGVDDKIIYLLSINYYTPNVLKYVETPKIIDLIINYSNIDISSTVDSSTALETTSQTFLHYNRNFCELAKYLMQKYPTEFCKIINTQNNFGRTPLHTQNLASILDYNPSFLTECIKGGFDPRIIDNCGKTVLGYTIDTLEQFINQI